jgi:hypothetical protein
MSTPEPTDTSVAKRPLGARLRRIAKLLIWNAALIMLVFVLFFLLLPMSQNFTALRKDMLVLDESLVPRYKPNLRDAVYRHGSLSSDPDYEPIRLSTNSLGFRDYDHPAEKPPGTIRVAFCGDSFVFGMDVPQADTLPSLLEAEFARRGGLNGQRVEVFNFGLPGLNFEGMGRVAQLYAVPTKPDVVLFSFISDDISRTDVITLQEWMRPIDSVLRVLPKGLANFISDDLIVRYKMARYGFDYRVLKAFPSLYRERVRVVAEYLKSLADEGGFRLGVVDFSRFPPARQAFRAFRAEHGEDALRLISDFPLELNPVNAHPTVNSNRSTAPVIADAIEEMLANP